MFCFLAFSPFFISSRLATLIRNSILKRDTPYKFPVDLKGYKGLEKLAQGVQKELGKVLRNPNPDPQSSFQFYYWALELHNRINTAYYEFVKDNPKTKPQFWAHKLFTLVPLTRFRTRCIRLNESTLKSDSIPGVSWEAVKAGVARSGWVVTSVVTDGYSASVVYAREGTRKRKWTKKNL